MLNKFFPGLGWLVGYDRTSFKSDFMSGLAIAVMLIPQGMAYAVVAGLPPEYGLYACIVPPIIYALLGTSNKISIAIRNVAHHIYSKITITISINI